jgi:Ca2+-binding EF-hand superfamily protein
LSGDYQTFKNKTIIKLFKIFLSLSGVKPIDNLSEAKLFMEENMKKIIFLCLICLFISAPAYAVKSDTPAVKANQNNEQKILTENLSQSITDAFNALDINKDGKLSKNEFTTFMSSVHKDADKNKNSFLDYVEFIEYSCGTGKLNKKTLPNKNKKILTSPVIKYLDINKDGKLDNLECTEYNSQEFINIDKNRDTKLTTGEFTNYYTEVFETMEGPNKNGIITIREYRVHWFGKPEASEPVKKPVLKR